jgi:hypothetical protein
MNVVFLKILVGVKSFSKYYVYDILLIGNDILLL